MYGHNCAAISYVIIFDHTSYFDAVNLETSEATCSAKPPEVTSTVHLRKGTRNMASTLA